MNQTIHHFNRVQLDNSLFEFGSPTSQVKFEQYFMINNFQIRKKKKNLFNLDLTNKQTKLVQNLKFVKVMK